MGDFSLVEKLDVLMNIILSSPLFLFCSVFGILLLIFFIICLKKEKRVNKWIFIAVWLLLILILIINHTDIFLNIVDAFFDGIFMALYFPNITVYTIFISILNIVLMYSLASKKVNKGNKIINFICTLIVDFLLVLIIDIINGHNINIYDSLTIYTNSNLLVLFQLTSAVFVSWILLNLLVLAHIKLKKYDKIEYPKMPEILFEDN